MLTPNQIQAGLIAKTKAKATIVALLVSGGANEIREDEWQGTTFAYPNIRIAVGAMVPVADCNKWTVQVQYLCFSEEASSKEANAIAAEVVGQFHDKSFSQGSVRYIMGCTSLIPAVRVEERTWKATVNFRVTVEPVP